MVYLLIIRKKFNLARSIYIFFISKSKKIQVFLNFENFKQNRFPLLPLSSSTLSSPILLIIISLISPILISILLAKTSIVLIVPISIIVLLKVLGFVVFLFSSDFSQIFLFLLFDVVSVSVEEEIRHDFPFFGSREFAFQSQGFSGEEPPHKTDRVFTLVVAGDDNVDVFERRVNVTEADDWDVDVGSLSNGLVIDGGIGDDDQFRLFVAALGVIGVSTWGKSTGAVGATNKSSKFQNSSMAHFFGGNDANVFRVFDSSNNSSSENDLLPHFVGVDDVGASGVFLINVLAHLVVAVVGA